MRSDSSSALPPLDGKCQEPDGSRGSGGEEWRKRRKFVSSDGIYAAHHACVVLIVWQISGGRGGLDGLKLPD